MTDSWDQRCLDSILVRFFAPKTLESSYKFSQSPVYYAPHDPTLKGFQDYIENLPLTDEPEIFGMHENANLAFLRQETGVVITTILDLQPRSSGGSGGVSTDEIVQLMADQILAKIDVVLDIEEVRDINYLDELATILLNLFRDEKSCLIWIIRAENTQ